MNIYLEGLFEKYNISDRDRYEIRQVYNLLPDNKKQRIVNNFESLVVKLETINEQLEIEKNILIWEAVIEIKKKSLEKYKKEENKDFRKEINILKEEI